MNPTSPTTYRILLAILAGTKASQREIARELEVSVGQANKVFQWLEENGFIERSTAARRSPRGRIGEVYALSNPTGLLRAISLFRPMNRLRVFTVSVSESKSLLLADLRAHSVVFCLGTALERFSRFYRSDEISFYVTSERGLQGADEIRKSLAAKGEGIARVSCYFLDTKTHGRRASDPERVRDGFAWLRDCGMIEKTKGGYFTTKVQTVVDLFCDGKAYAARDLLRELWGVRL